MLYFSHWLQLPSVTVLAVGDLHIGSPQSKFRELQNLIRGAPESTFFLFVGDVIDNALIDSLGNVYDAEMNPHESLQEFYELLRQVRDRTLGVVSGNHEYRTKRRVGIDPLSFICGELGIPYSPDILVLDVAVGDGKNGRGSRRRSDYVLVAGHGYTSARTVGGKITANARLADVITNADVYITGHTHQPSVVKLNRFLADTRNKKLLDHEYYVVTIPAWLGYEEYAARKFYQPSASGVVEIRLSGTKKEVEIVLR